MPVTPDKVVVDSMDKLHGNTDFTNFAAYSWNIFRYIGDYLHLFGILVLLVTIAKNKSVAGISRSTQVLYCAIFITRYLDLFDHSQTAYLVIFKLTYIITSIIVLILFHQLDGTYERRHDTFNIAVVLLPCATAALLLTNEYSMLEILWTFSEFVEGFAMVPQYIFCYRCGPRDVGQSLYVIALGGYRVFYALNWIYKKIQMPHYSDIQSWLGGIIEIMFFLDFLNYRFTGNSMLRTMVLSVDTKINEISEKVELKVLGSSRAERIETEGGEIRRRKKGGEEQMDGVV
jgi:ER lumen protein retaining receptor